MNLRFKLDKETQTSPDSLSYFARRIAGLIDPDATAAPNATLREESGHASTVYQLGDSKKWFLRFHPESNELAISYRNAKSHFEAMCALGEFIEQFLHIPWINRPTTPEHRIRELQSNYKLTKENSFTYSWHNGYEKLDTDRYHFAGAHHPNVVCEGGGICEHCGRVI